MKKSPYALLALMLLCGCSVGRVVAFSSPKMALEHEHITIEKNLLSNSSFESGFSPWQLWYNEFGSAADCVLSEGGAFHGKRYVQVTSRKNAMTMLTSKAVPFILGQSYTLSAAVKGTPGKKLVFEFYGVEDVNRWFPVKRVQKTITLTDQWQQVSLKGSLPKTELNRCFVAFRPDRNEVGTFSVDAVQLLPDEDIVESIEEPQPHFSFYFGAESHSLLNTKGGVYQSSESVPLKGSVYNPAGEFRGALECQLYDVDGSVIFSEQQPIVANAGERVAFDSSLSGQPLGWYRVDLKLLDDSGLVLDRQVSGFVRIEERMDSEPEDSPFGVCVLGNPDVELDRAVAIGVKHVRMHDCGFFWRNIFPSVNGPANWRADAIVERMSDAGLIPFPYIGQGLKPEDRRSSHNPNVVGDLPAYEAFFQTLTAHYRGAISAYEVENEPYFRMNAGEYTSMLKAAYTGAKEGDPDCTVVGVSGDPQTHGGFVNEVLEKGGVQWMDAMSIHVYVQPDAPEWRLPEVLKAARATFNATGGAEKEIWLTETGYKGSERDEIPQRKPAARNQFISLKQYASYLVRTHVLTLGNGINRLYWFSMGTPGPYVYPWSMNEPDTFYSPKPVVAAYAAMTQRLATLRFVDSPVNGSGCYAYRFSGESGNVAVIWSVEEGGGFLPVKAKGATVLDLFGNPVEVQRDGEMLFVPLSEMPHYVCSDEPAVPHQIVSIAAPEEWDVSAASLPLTISFSNPYERLLSGRWEWNLPQGWNASELELSLVPGETQTHTVNVRLSAKDKQTHLRRILSGRLVADAQPQQSALILLDYILKPTAIDHDIWFEAEAPDYANFDVHPEYVTAAFGGGVVKLDTTSPPVGTDGFMLGYNVRVEQAGEYEVYVASLAAGQSWSSPIDWRIGDAPFQRVVTESRGFNSYSYDPMRPNAQFHFFKLGEVRLSAGSQPLELKISGKRKMDSKFVMKLDAVCLKKK